MSSDSWRSFLLLDSASAAWRGSCGGEGWPSLWWHYSCLTIPLPSSPGPRSTSAPEHQLGHRLLHLVLESWWTGRLDLVLAALSVQVLDSSQLTLSQMPGLTLLPPCTARPAGSAPSGPVVTRFLAPELLVQPPKLGRGLTRCPASLRQPPVLEQQRRVGDASLMLSNCPTMPAPDTSC